MSSHVLQSTDIGNKLQDLSERTLRSEEETCRFGAELAGIWRAGDTVLLEGPLGAGKTTLVRGIMGALGYAEPVRSPTFNLIQTFATDPPVMHADLYRVKSAQGIGLEDYLESHLCLIEWPDRLQGLIEEAEAWKVNIQFSGESRLVTVARPKE